MILSFRWAVPVLIAWLCSIAGAAEILYVAPDGKEGAVGLREAPLASVEEAVKRLTGSGGGGVIRLRGGVYRESVRVTGNGNELLVIEAEPGEVVRFEGGEALANGEPWPGREGLFVLPARETKAVWDPAKRVRFLHQMDAAGVAAWPGSFVALDDGRLLVHPVREGSMDGVMADRLETGFVIARSRTTLRRLQFGDFLGVPGATAVRIGKASDVLVEECLMENIVRGIVIERDVRDVRVARCVIRDVATGIQFGGIGLEAEGSVFLAAVGDYAIRGEAEYDWSNGIRFYHPAEKGTIRHCLTAGFWAGMYHKTTPGLDGAKPFLCEGNIFLDSIKIGAAGQGNSVYRANVISGGIFTFQRLAGTGAKVEENYFFNSGTKREGMDEGSGNRWGDDPFRDRAAGNLELMAAVRLPEAAMAEVVKARPSDLSWSADLVAHYRESSSGTLRWAKPVVAASAQGALVTVALTTPAQGTLRYRPAGRKKEWQSVKATSVGFSSDETLAGLEWEEDTVETENSRLSNRLVFLLTGDAVRKGLEYEAEVEIAEAGTSELFRFTTRGAPRTLTTGPGREYPRLQDALDRALPGDTVALAAAVFTEPALLLHGGTPEHPLVIAGEGEQKTILDGGKKFGAFLELRNAPYVTVRGVQVRHFDRAGIVVRDSPHFTVENSLFRNKREGRSITQGTGVLLTNSPDARVVYNTFTRLLYGMQAHESPRLVLEHNTAFNNVFSSALLRDSALGSRVRYNSFTFTGNTSFYIREQNPKAFESLVCDFNNYGTIIRKIGAVASRAYAEAGVTPGEPEPEFPVPERYGHTSGSKRIIDYVPGGGGKEARERFFNMEAWKRFSSKDASSIYADPGYVDPLKGDFRLLPGSFNQLPDGKLIGSGTVAGPTPDALL